MDESCMRMVGDSGMRVMWEMRHRGGRRWRTKQGKESRREKHLSEETSQYPEEKKSTEIPSVAASERGTALKPLGS